MKANIEKFPAQEIYPDKIVILGKEIEADFCDAELYDRFEVIRKEAAAYKPTEGGSPGDAIREQCTFVFDCFDELFGAGTAEYVFGNRTNLRLCLQAFGELISQANGQVKAISNITAGFAGNRAQRRFGNKNG